ncbi:DUF4259 domain-containing protein [Streptomyces sp. RS2]|uniref:DUF4259 domain-containing protein n=1 Tax=Streptomyces sp. RS2 TaxID=1451205 RepID=UPI0021F8A2BE|nr:DUF4259 domain-containing protein [Streptomyces sp. RS2]MCW1100161.1 DUF4259 domain-containing protein [Streptomyces sp. RS2]
MITARQREEIIVGNWDIGSFENDMAADFACTLGERAPDRRGDLVRATLSRTIQARTTSRAQRAWKLSQLALPLRHMPGR